MKKQCPTCPFRREGYTCVVRLLAERALSEATPICHCTGPDPIGKRISKEPRGCRGARDLQLRFFAAIGFLDSPTDEAWDQKAKELL